MSMRRPPLFSIFSVRRGRGPDLLTALRALLERVGADGKARRQTRTRRLRVRASKREEETVRFYVED